MKHFYQEFLSVRSGYVHRETLKGAHNLANWARRTATNYEGEPNTQMGEEAGFDTTINASHFRAAD
jgi:hypothetical protein